MHFVAQRKGLATGKAYGLGHMLQLPPKHVVVHSLAAAPSHDWLQWPPEQLRVLLALSLACVQLPPEQSSVHVAPAAQVCEQ